MKRVKTFICNIRFSFLSNINIRKKTSKTKKARSYLTPTTYLLCQMHYILSNTFSNSNQKNFIDAAIKLNSCSHTKYLTIGIYTSSRKIILPILDIHLGFSYFLLWKSYILHHDKSWSIKIPISETVGFKLLNHLY